MISKLIGEACKDQGHAWEGDTSWLIVRRWVGKGQMRRHRRIAERQSPCMRGDCGGIAVDRATVDLSRIVGKRYIKYTVPEYLRQELNGGPVTRHSARLYRARQQAADGGLEEAVR